VYPFRDPTAGAAGTSSESSLLTYIYTYIYIYIYILLAAGHCTQPAASFKVVTASMAELGGGGWNGALGSSHSSHELKAGTAALCKKKKKNGVAKGRE
jgi:hypothetical protein